MTSVECSNVHGPQMINASHMLQMLLPDMPVIYMGDELGMTDTFIRKDQLVNDWSKAYGFSQEKSRTPFQWDSTAQAGFSKKTKL